MKFILMNIATFFEYLFRLIFNKKTNEELVFEKVTQEELNTLWIYLEPNEFNLMKKDDTQFKEVLRSEELLDRHKSIYGRRKILAGKIESYLVSKDFITFSKIRSAHLESKKQLLRLKGRLIRIAPISEMPILVTVD